MTKLISGRVKKIPSANVSASRYEFLKLSEAEPDLGLPSGNGYVLSGNVDGTRRWVLPLTAESLGNLSINLSSTSINALADVDTVTTTPVLGYGLIWNGTNWVPNVITVSSTELSNIANVVLNIVQNSIVANVANTVSTLSNFTTANLVEGLNLYFTNTRVYANVTELLPNYTGNLTAYNITANQVTANIWSGLYTANVVESVGNLYYTNARARAAISAGDGSIIYDPVAGTIKATNSITANIESTVSNLTTANIAEAASNLYYTNARSYANLTAASINALSDVDTVSVTPQVGYGLTWNGTNWVPNVITVSSTELSNVANTVLGIVQSSLVANTAFFASNANIANIALTANIANTVLTLDNFTTSNLIEGANLYFTNTRVYANVSERLLNLDSNIVPAQDEVYNLGSPTRKFKDLYLSGFTINLGNTVLSSGQNGALALNSLIANNVTSNTWVNLYTANVIESTSNLYFTNARVYANIAPLLTTANVTEIASNLYFTNARVYANISPLLTTANVREIASNLYFTNARVYANIAPLLTTANIAEVGSNIYYNNTRVYSNVVSLLTTYTGNISAGNIITGGGSITGANLISANTISATTWTGLYTSNVIENAGLLFYTNARVYSNVVSLLQTYTGNLSAGNIITSGGQGIITGAQLISTNVITANIWTGIYTANVIESVGNLYFTNARAAANVIGLLPSLAGDNILIEANGRISATTSVSVGTIAGLNTANVNEFGNLYYTNSRVYSNVVSLLSNYTGNLNAGNIITSGGDGIITGAQLISANVITANIWNGLYTANVIESASNLYYTNARVSSNVIGLLPSLAGQNINIAANGQISAVLSASAIGTIYTSNVIENGDTTTGNVYFSNARARAAISAGDNSIIYDPVAGTIKATSSITANIESTVSNLTTANVTEAASNLYYTNARARAAISSGTGVSYNATTGQISIGQNVDTHANVTFGELNVTGNLNVFGNVVGFYANTLVVNDPLIQLGVNNPSDSIDIGFIGHYNDTGTERHAGLFRDASDKKFKFFDNITGEPSSSTVDTANTTFRLANVVATTFEGNVVGNVTGFVSSISNFTTANLVEGTQLYYTNARVYSNVAPLFGAKANVVDLTTANVVESAGNLYYTNTRVYSNVVSLLPTYAGDITASNITVTSRLTANAINATSIYGSSIGGSITGANLISTNNMNANILVANALYTNTIIGTATGGFITGANLISTNIISATTWIGIYTSNVIENAGLLYYTNARVASNVIGLLPSLAGDNITIEANGRISAASSGTVSAGSIQGLNTANVNEFGNLYFTNARVYANVIGLLDAKANVTDLTTANVIESASNLYYTNARAILNVIPAITELLVTAPGLYYSIDQYSGNNPAIDVRAGETIAFGLNTPGHPFMIRVSAGGSNYDTGLTHVATDGTVSTGSAAQGKVSGRLFWKIPYSLAGSTYVYQCSIHGGMVGSIVISKSVNSTTDLNEGSNLYYTNTRVASNVIGLLPTLAGDNITIEANGRISAASSGSVSAGSIQGLNTANVNEFGNLYYTNSRVYANVLELLPTLAGNNISIAANGQISAVVSLASLTGNITVDGNLNATGSMTANNIVITSPGIPTITSDSNIILSPANALLITSTTRVSGNIFSSSNVIATNYVFANGLVINGQEFVSGTENVTNINATNVVANTFVTNTLIINGFELFSNNDISVNRITANIWNNLYTSNVIENGNTNIGNVYFTNARVFANVVSLLSTYTGNINASNINVSNIRATSIVTTNIIINGFELFSNNDISVNRITSNSWNNLYTANILEAGSNIFYTNTRVYSNVISLLPTYTGNISAGNIRANSIVTSNIIINGFELFSNNDISVNRVTANIWTNLYTANVIESASNLYYTNARVYANVFPLLASKANVVDLTTANVVEVGSAIYYTNTRVYSNVVALLPVYTGNISASNMTVTSLLTANAINVGSIYGSATGGSITGANLITANTIIAENVQATLFLTGYGTGGSLTGANLVSSNNITTINLTAANIITGAGTGGYITGANLISTNNISSLNWIGLYASNVIENGTTTTGNVFFTNSRARTAFTAGTGITIDYNTGVITSLATGTVNAETIVGLTTSNIAEGSNLYYTNTRVYSNVLALLPVYNGNLAAGNVTFANLTVTGTTNFYGNVTTYGSNNLSISDNMIYLNNGSTASNPDLGFAGNYNDGSYKHTGFFRDATDGVWKIFDSYTPEPDASQFIDTSHASFRLANLSATSFTGNVVGNVTGFVSSIGNFTTSNLTEGSNLYYTNTRVYANVLALLPNYTGNLGGANITIGSGTGGSITGANLISANIITASIWNGLYTANVSESSSNLYFTNTRVSANVIGLLPSLAGNNIIIEANGRISANLSGVSFATTAGSIQGLNTANVNEFGNLYYTNARVYANVLELLPTYTGNLGGANITIGTGTGGSITGANLISANIITVGVISATGNITGANLTVTGALVANALILQGVNVTGSVLTGNLSSNATVSDTIVANSVTSNIWGGLYTSNVIENGNTTSGNVYFTNTRAIAAFTAGDNITIAANGQISASVSGSGSGGSSQLAITNSQVLSGGNQNYTLASVINSANTILVSINGVVQIPSIDYTLSGGQGLVFTANTPANAAIEVKFYGYSALNPNVAVISSSSIIPTVEGQASYLMGANASQAATVMVALDGLIQRPTVDYTVNNTTITMIPAPPAGSNIEVRFFGQEAVALSAAQSTTAYISNSRTYAGGSANLNLGSNVLLARNIIVTVDGITQIPDLNYTVSGNTLSFGTSVPSTSSIVEVKFFGAEAFNANLTYAMVQTALPAVLSNDTQIRQIIRSSAYAFSRIFY